jgi:hypothetical protein
MSNKPVHDFTDGDLVVDTQLRETFVYSHKKDAHRAKFIPKALRHATEAERKAYERKPQAKR